MLDKQLWLDEAKNMINDMTTEEFKQFLELCQNTTPPRIFPRIDVTLDAVVIYNDHILLVQRGREPGMGKWALPGGYLNPDEALEDGAIRELIEETAIDCSPDYLKRCILTSHCFSGVNRSTKGRGRIITHAFFIILKGFSEDIPAVVGLDDARDAKWIHLDDYIQNYAPYMFEDHAIIINYFINWS
jgi:bifunctional NMN adenylyltransferase/nudix hydrolase